MIYVLSQCDDIMLCNYCREITWQLDKVLVLYSNITKEYKLNSCVDHIGRISKFLVVFIGQRFDE